jgi:TolB-like protein
MKKVFSIILLCAAAGLASAQNMVNLDEAIQMTAVTITRELRQGSKVVVLNFSSPSQRLSNYVIDELTGALVREKKLILVDRQNLALIQQEMNFQMSGEVSDASAQEIGQKLGAQTIISGSAEDMKTYYRVRFKAIEVVSAALQVQDPYNVKKDNTITALTGNTGNASVSVSVGGATAYPNGLNFSTGRKVGAGFLNWIYGVGSFTMGDWVGGLIVAGAELTGVIILFDAALNMTSYEQALLGIGINWAGVIFGHIRPFTYDIGLAKKNGTYFALSDSPLDNIGIALLPNDKGSQTVLLSYSFSY